jgi:hypothetical protein
MFSVVGWQDGAGHAANAATAAIFDDHITAAGALITVSQESKLMGGIACIGAGGTIAEFQSPSLRRLNPYEISPLVLGIVPTPNLDFELDYSNGIPLDVNEGLEAWYLGAAATEHTILAWLCDQPQAPVSGKILHVRYTFAAIATVLNAWIGGPIVLPVLLPTGKYQVVGARCFAATAVGFRFNPVGDPSRPGGICQQALTDENPVPFRDGYMGKWFELDTNQLPGLQLATSAAGAVAGSGDLDILIP